MRTFHRHTFAAGAILLALSRPAAGQSLPSAISRAGTFDKDAYIVYFTPADRDPLPS